jgi:hypothetical protein
MIPPNNERLEGACIYVQGTVRVISQTAPKPGRPECVAPRCGCWSPFILKDDIGTFGLCRYHFYERHSLFVRYRVPESKLGLTKSQE